ncbi:hypothetical protein Thpro_022045 [Acidihalobacter prosperus]|uniref:Uncharacterized protein n=1 Tax=Acidihalobacter prosperus TaxID=160660 RepID=A0A1A6C580_9GAMM|nr:hypothetical protein Thpro_022045 [Acidihalobacter prosperus]
MPTGTGLAGIAPPIPWRSKKDLSQSLFAACRPPFTTSGHAEKDMCDKFVVIG